MSEQFEHELARSIARIQDAIAPYTRFVRDQQAKFTGIEENLNASATSCARSATGSAIPTPT